MDYLIKTLDIIENVMGIVAELDPGQKPSISEDLGDLRLMKQQLKKACGGEYSQENSKLNMQSVSNSLPTGDEIWLKAQETSRFNFEDWWDKLVGNDC